MDRAAQRPPRVGQQPRRLGGGALGQAREFPGPPGDRGLLFLAGLRGPGAQLRGDGVRPPTRAPSSAKGRGAGPDARRREW
jgi:hypothetical protein